MSKHRLRFSKTGRAAYISHLDLMRTFQRAFMRSGLRVGHTEGFNPHAFVSIALPMPVGQESRCELLDFVLTDGDIEQVPERVNPCFPDGIAVHEAYGNGRGLKELAFIKCRTTLLYDNGISSGAAESIKRFLDSGQQVIVPKKGKKGIIDTDIRPLIHDFEISPEGGGQLNLQTLISAQYPGLNPDYIAIAIGKYLPQYTPDFHKSRRIEVYDWDMNIFR